LRFSQAAGVDAVDFPQLLQAVWAQICELHNQLQDNNNFRVLVEKIGGKKQLDALQKYLKILVMNITKNESVAEVDKNQLNLLANHENQSLIKKVQTNIAVLKKAPSKGAPAEETKKFLEHADHFSDRARELLALKDRNNLHELVKAKSFRVEHWNKSDIRTYLLGNYVGCCLATDGFQFPALIQRRMDDAMFMHVVIDEETELPVALNWLFYAKDENKPENGVKVVANFFEIHSRFGLHTAQRDLIVNMLMKFTGEYFVPDIGASDFIMVPLRYGHIPDFQQFEWQTADLKKVGGFLSLDEHDDDAKARYYLNGLDRERFHRYDGKKQEGFFQNHAYKVSETPEFEGALPSKEPGAKLHGFGFFSPRLGINEKSPEESSAKNLGTFCGQ